MRKTRYSYRAVLGKNWKRYKLIIIQFPGTLLYIISDNSRSTQLLEVITDNLEVFRLSVTRLSSPVRTKILLSRNFFHKRNRHEQLFENNWFQQRGKSPLSATIRISHVTKQKKLTKGRIIHTVKIRQPANCICSNLTLTHVSIAPRPSYSRQRHIYRSTSRKG